MSIIDLFYYLKRERPHYSELSKQNIAEENYCKYDTDLKDMNRQLNQNIQNNNNNNLKKLFIINFINNKTLIYEQQE